MGRGSALYQQRALDSVSLQVASSTDTAEDQKIKVWQLSQRMQKCGKASLKRKFDQNPLDTTLKVLKDNSRSKHH
eukprot:4012293-Amphidinium_carterae.1